MPRRLTIEEFIEKAKKVHVDRYDYSEVEYVDGKTDVTIICRDHGPFPQTPNTQLAKKGCPKCGGSKQLTTQTFIEKAKKMHGDRYDYSSVKYVDARTPVTIICPAHGPFPQRPTNHLQGRGCRDGKTVALSLLKTSTTEREAEILSQYAGDKYYGPDLLVGAGNSELFTHDIFRAG